MESEIVTYVPDTPVTLDIDFPTLRPDFEASRPAPLVVRVGDRVIINDQRPFHPTEPYEVFLGFNGSNSSLSAQLFQGRIIRVESLAEPIASSLGQLKRVHGPIRLSLRLPAFSSARSEPLLVTGISGAADSFYIQYVDEKHIRVGYDHWGVGGPVSPPIPVDYGASHVVEMSLGSLYPDPADPAWEDIAQGARLAARSRAWLKLNGAQVLAVEQAAYPASADQISIGRNGIGLSTSGSRFTGVIAAQEHLGLSSPP